MGFQRLSAKKKRLIERSTGLGVVRALRYTNDVWLFVTPEHEHYLFDVRHLRATLEHTPTHFSTCSEIF